jgi:acyl carrier protein
MPGTDGRRAGSFAAAAPASAPVDPAAPLRDQVNVDSMDFLNFVVALHKTCGVDIPEPDYEKLGTVDEIVAYLLTRLEKDDADGEIRR